jgi:hypothetical protein
MSVTRFARMAANKDEKGIVRIVKDYRTIASTSVTYFGGQAKVLGTVLHVSKGKKLTFTGRVADKKIKREISYYRMVFCR